MFIFLFCRIKSYSPVLTRSNTYKMLNSSKFLTHFRKLSTRLHLDELPPHKSLVVEKYGDPSENIKLKIQNPKDVLPSEIEPKQIFVEHLAACVNPADLNLAQGVYGVRPPLPAIIGNEGVFRVKAVGSEEANLKPGDYAISVSLTGYWQNYSIQDANTLYKVNNELDINIAAQLKVNPCTAYRMLKDFVDVREGQTVIQNGANSAVGVYVIQLAKLWGIKTINVIRDRPNKSEIVKELKDYGADHVLTEAEVSNVEIMTPLLRDIGKPKLFLNCVGGKNASDCQRSLDIGGQIVTYGAMSKQSFAPSATQLIFKDYTLRGFWMSRWYKDREPNRRSEISALLNEVGNMFSQGVLRPKSSTLITFEDRNIAFTESNNTKYIFSINN